MMKLPFRLIKRLLLQNHYTCPNGRLLHTSCVLSSSSEPQESPLLRQLKAKMLLSGPLTVADYMKEVLTNPTAGYYMNQDVFGAKGDFTTSPEISQMFGELVGIWCVNEWMQCGSPPSIQVVELGPGRGTLADDMLRVFSQFELTKDLVSLHLVEVSPKLTRMQEEKLTDKQLKGKKNHNNDENPLVSSYKSRISKYGPKISWYTNLNEVPKGFSFYIAHEFFDALPIHKFQKKDGQWHEVLVDLDDTKEGVNHLRYVLARGHTPASKLLLHPSLTANKDHIEICGEGGAIVQEISHRISRYGGFSLIVDYGHNGEKSDTFRAFKDHNMHNPLQDPGTADITADVDFSYLKAMVGDEVSTYGPITQEKFLHNMGIGLRLEMLFGKANAEQRQSLLSGYDMLTNPEKMGERFKFFSIMQRKTEDFKPAGFSPLRM